jgi:hypothetical protein
MGKGQSGGVAIRYLDSCEIAVIGLTALELRFVVWSIVSTIFSKKHNRILAVTVG